LHTQLGQLGLREGAGFLDEAGAVFLHRLGADAELDGDGLGTQALGLSGSFLVTSRAFLWP